MRIRFFRVLSPYLRHSLSAAGEPEAAGGVLRAFFYVEVIDVLDVIVGHFYAEMGKRPRIHAVPQGRRREQRAVEVENVACKFAKFHQYQISGANLRRYLRETTLTAEIRTHSALFSPRAFTARISASYTPAFFP